MNTTFLPTALFVASTMISHTLAAQPGDVLSDVSVFVRGSLTGNDTRPNGLPGIAEEFIVEEIADLPAEAKGVLSEPEYEDLNGGRIFADLFYANNFIEVQSVSTATSASIPGGELQWNSNVIYDMFFTLVEEQEVFITRCHYHEGDLDPESFSSSWFTLFGTSSAINIDVQILNENTNCETFSIILPADSYRVWCDSSAFAAPGTTESVLHTATFQFIVPPPFLPSDLNQDYCTDGADLGILISEWATPGKSDADLNMDGKVDGKDLGLFLLDWGICVPG